MTANISTIAKKFLNPELKTLIKAGFINNDLSLTSEGESELQAILMEENITKLATRAQEKIDEEAKN